MSELAGMTVNERLHHTGLIEQFDNAIFARNEAEAISVLRQVELSSEQATETVVTIFENPAKYGYQ